MALGRLLSVYVTRLSLAAVFGTIRRCPLPSAQAKPYTAVAGALGKAAVDVLRGAAAAGALRETTAAAVVAKATSRRMNGLPRTK
ncbi:hypothetical protein GCM10009850_066990 [Nonomuraea monospora]|uniref:DUF4235 domain-containing protein n=1 Tax=Nonomuraea monospora TaxID=568818 RepID=A0ABN3CQ13_9ACTN